jgi:hypothetical protein
MRPTRKRPWPATAALRAFLGAELRRHGGAGLRPWTCLDGVIDDEAEVDDRNLEDHHEEHELQNRVLRHAPESTRQVPERTVLGDFTVSLPELGYDPLSFGMNTS